MAALIVRGDALRLPLRDASVDLVVTSPPYWQLRAYHTGHAAEVGSEATPRAWLEALWAATAELARVLKPTGSIFVNLGDSYADRANTGPSAAPGSSDGTTGRARRPGRPRRFAVPRKSLYGLPWAYALGCTGMLAALGGPDPGLRLLLRAELVWAKPNPLPDSARDRVRRTHETWLHLVKTPGYYAAVDELREPYNPAAHAAGPGGARWRDGVTAPTWGKGGSQSLPVGIRRTPPHPLGKPPGSVWTIPSEPLNLPGWLGVDHYAAFPSEWPRRLVLGWSPLVICLACGQGRFPVVDQRTDTSERPGGYQRRRGAMTAADDGDRPGGSAFGVGPSVRGITQAVVLGYACACTPYTDHLGTGERDHALRRRGSGKIGWHQDDRIPMPTVGPWREYHLSRWAPPPTRPAVVLDPFCGTGTTVMVARALGRVGIGVDLSADYCRLARWRAFDPGQAAKARARTWAGRQATLTHPREAAP